MAPAQAAPRSALIVNNDAAVRDMLLKLFTGEGYHVALAGSGAEGLKIAASSSIDIALVDQLLPDFSGVELKKKLMKASPKTQVVVLSSFTTIRSSDDVLRFGFSDFILDQRELLELLQGGVSAPVMPSSAPAPDERFERLKKCLIDTIDVMVGLQEINDPFFGGNSHITMEYARSIAEEMKLSPETIDEIVVGALLHDIGRVGIKSDILQGKREITEAEYKTLRGHCENGAKVIESIDFPWKIKPIIIHHHERYDGKGYPSGLKGREIPIGARILSVVDAFAAMTAHRPYRSRSLTKEEAIHELHKNVGSQFDPEVVEVFSIVVDRKFFFRGMGPKPMIMMVDDEIDYLTLIKLRLVNEGFDVTTFDNAQDALENVEKSAPDLIVSDILMPGMDGIGMFRKIRESGASYAETPLTSSAARTTRSRRSRPSISGRRISWSSRSTSRSWPPGSATSSAGRQVAKGGASTSQVTGVVGDLKNLGIPEIVQTLHLGLKTACVSIKGPIGEGRIYFENGRIRHAERGPVSGESAFYEMLRWQEGPFRSPMGSPPSFAPSRWTRCSS
jgi:putative nucleotidyltransferase with HDIG domain